MHACDVRSIASNTLAAGGLAICTPPPGRSGGQPIRLVTRVSCNVRWITPHTVALRESTIVSAQCLLREILRS